MRVTVWHEYRHEHTDPKVAAVYPEGMHQAIKAGIQSHLPPTAQVRTATLDEPEHGLTEDVLNVTDVMTWWGHCAHGDVDDTIAAKVQERVLEGMGLVVLHSAHYAKPFKRLMGTNCHLRWREDGQAEKLWCVSPGHPLTAGLGLDPERPVIELPHTEMYGEPFDVRPPEEVVFISNFAGGEVFRSVCVWRCGAGRVIYIRPGHETYPIYHNPTIQKLIANAVSYAMPDPGTVSYVNSSPKYGEDGYPVPFE